MDIKKEIKLLVAILTLFIGIIYSGKVQAVTDLESLPYDSSEMAFLSDLDYEKDMSYIENGNTFCFDENASSNPITLLYNDEIKKFDKGISAWATSNLVYDVSNYNYDKFTAYIGIDAKQTNDYFNDGAVITIYTSNDGVNWNTAYKTATKKGVLNADYVDIPIKGVKYIRLYAYSNGGNWWSHWYDDVIYADARLSKNDYVENIEPDTNIHTLDWYDNFIRNNDFSTKDYELYLLQRELVSNIGYDSMQFFMKYNRNIGNALKWLMNDKEALEYYIMGGEPDGTYKKSLEVLADLYKKYHEDINDTTTTERGVVLGNLYKRMMITLSLTHSAPVGTWITGAPKDPNNPNGSNAVNRYFIYKKMHKKGLLKNEIFEKLTIEEMRMVMNNIIDDEEIEWLNNYSRTKRDGMNPYSYITYTFGYDYAKEQYYSESMRDYWTEKYNLNGEGWDLTFKPTYGYKKLYVVFEEGSVCGGIAKTGVNLQTVYGVPSSVVGQPGHAAYIHMALDANGNKTWVLGNDVSGWSQSGRTEKLSIRLPLGWGSGKASSGYVVSYMPLIQAAFDDYENYKQAEEYIMLANIFKDNITQAEKYYRKALEVQKFNFDAWVGLIDTYVAAGKSEAKLNELAEEIANTLTYYPLPMDNLLSYIGKYLRTEGEAFRLHSIRVRALNKAKNATNDNTLQPNICKTVAKYLVGDVEENVVEFTFDGTVTTAYGSIIRRDENGKPYAGYILLSEEFKDNEIYWQYMINGRDWKDASGIAYKLIDEELATINPETGVKVRIMGALDTVYAINITKGDPPNIYGNDLENSIFGIDNNAVEYWNNETQSWDSAFALYFDSETWEMRDPVFEGNQVVYFRNGAFRTSTASDILAVTFTEDNTDPTQSYIKKSRLTLDAVSSSDSTNTKDKAINGNRGDFWCTSKAEAKPENRYFTIKIDKPTFVSALEYIPRLSGVSGMIRNAQIQVSEDGKNWTTAVKSTNWEENAESKYVVFDKPYLAQYVKIIGMETSDDYMSAALINLFEDTTESIQPTATVEYSINTLTNKDVVATLIPDKYVEVTNTDAVKNEDGKYTYTFKENGKYTFTFKDIHGNTGTAEAKVDWIDKVKPEAKIKYSTEDNTSGSVIATLINDESIDKNITIINNNGSDTYVFEENGSFEFTYKDEAGNENSTMATVSWITKKAPNIALEYDISTPTNQPVTATVTGDTEFEITSNDKSKTHTFDDNGEWTFEYSAKGGFTGSITARVTWIDKEYPVVDIQYDIADLDDPEFVTNQPVTATLKSNEEIIIDNTEGVYKDTSGNYYHTFEENGEFTFKYHDIAGNAGSAIAKVNWIDTTLPEVDITYSKTTITNQPVLATLTCNEEITIVNNNGNDSIFFEKNGSFEFIYRDRAGNEGRKIAEVTWIDIDPPIGKVQYSTTQTTAGPVVATLVCDNEPITVINNDGKTTYEFDENGRFEFIFQDEAGNISSTFAEVTWILEDDITIEYSTSDITNKNVTATVIPNEGTNIKITNNNESFSHTFEQNGSFTFEYEDEYGNKGSITAEVTWIDKVAPVVEVQYDIANLNDPEFVTNQSVTATVISDKDIIIINDGNSTPYGKKFDYIFNNNSTMTLFYKDRAGNGGTCELEVNWIDKEAPQAEIEYSTLEPTTDSVVAKLVCNAEPIIIDNNNGSDEFTFNYNGTFEFLYHDRAGNTGSSTAKVTWIENSSVDNPPVITIPQKEFEFDISTDTEVDIEYFKNLITIMDDHDEININDADKVTIKSGLEWKTGNYIITITVKDSSNNVSELEIKVNIIDSSIDFTGLTFDIESSEFTYDGTPHTPKVTVKKDGKELIIDTDYTVAYLNNTNAGEAAVILNGLGHYKGTKVVNFTINKAKPIPNTYPKTEMEIANDIEKVGDINLPEGWTWENPEASLKVGDNVLKATYKIDNNYEVITMTITVKRLEKVSPNEPSDTTIDFTKLTIEIDGKEKDFIYNGKAHTPTIIVKNDKETLIENRDYMVKYKNNINVGTSTIIVKGLGKYVGTKELTFEIKKAQPSTIPEKTIQASKNAVKAGDINLPDGWRWENPNAILVEGENKLKAIFDGDSNHNYKELTIIVTRKIDSSTGSTNNEADNQNSSESSNNGSGNQQSSSASNKPNVSNSSSTSSSSNASSNANNSTASNDLENTGDNLNDATNSEETSDLSDINSSEDEDNSSLNVKNNPSKKTDSSDSEISKDKIPNLGNNSKFKLIVLLSIAGCGSIIYIIFSKRNKRRMR